MSSLESLTLLSACGNEYSSIAEEAILPHNLKVVLLERNKFDSLNDTCALRQLGKLERLSLQSNAIRSVPPYVFRPSALPVFPSSLQEVDFSNNSFDSWSFIDSLAGVFPGLKSLRVSGNPLYQNLLANDGKRLAADDGYMLTVARLACLTRLNFSNVCQFLTSVWAD